MTLPNFAKKVSGQICWTAILALAVSIGIVGCGGAEQAVESKATREAAGTVAMESSPAESGTAESGKAESGTAEMAGMDATAGGVEPSLPDQLRDLEKPAQRPNDGLVMPPGMTGDDPGADGVAADGVAAEQNGGIDMSERFEVVNPGEKAARNAFAEPLDATRLSPDANLWADTNEGRLIVDGYVALRQGPLEMFACPTGTKEHESVIAVLAKAREVHAGLLAIGADSGTPVSFSPEYRPATGQRIAIWVLWRDDQGTINKVTAQQMIQHVRSGKQLEADFVFAGSSFWSDPETGREYYQADSGDLVCVSNFSTATLDLPVESSQSNGELQFLANTDNIPPTGTPVRLVFIPIPLTGGEPADGEAAKADPKVAPEDALGLP